MELKLIFTISSVYIVYSDKDFGLLTSYKVNEICKTTTSFMLQHMYSLFWELLPIYILSTFLLLDLNVSYNENPHGIIIMELYVLVRLLLFHYL